MVVTRANPFWSFSGTWKIDRESKGNFVLDRSFKGAGIAMTEDPKNEAATRP